MVVQWYLIISSKHYNQAAFLGVVSWLFDTTQTQQLSSEN